MQRSCNCGECTKCKMREAQARHRKLKKKGLARKGVFGRIPSCNCGNCKKCQYRESAARHRFRKRMGLGVIGERIPMSQLENDTMEDIDLKRVEEYWERERDDLYYVRSLVGNTWEEIERL